MKQSCVTCRKRYNLEKLDYSNGGCEHSSMDGYACMAFANERKAAWMVGLKAESGMCEAYEPMEKVAPDCELEAATRFLRAQYERAQRIKFIHIPSHGRCIRRGDMWTSRRRRKNMGFDFKRFREDRDKAFMAFVMNDDWDAIKEYCTNYDVKMPDNPDVMAAGIYKAVQEVKDMPDEVKIKAAMKCMKLGFTPFMTSMEVKE